MVVSASVGARKEEFLAPPEHWGGTCTHHLVQSQACMALIYINLQLSLSTLSGKSINIRTKATQALICHWHLSLLLTGPCVVCGYCQHHTCYIDILNSKHPCTELHRKCTRQGIEWLRAHPENLNSPPKSWNSKWIAFKVVHVTKRLLISMTLFRHLSSKILATFYVKLTSLTFRAQHGN